jgi:hypothetical protein
MGITEDWTGIAVELGKAHESLKCRTNSVRIGDYCLVLSQICFYSVFRNCVAGNSVV